MRYENYIADAGVRPGPTDLHSGPAPRHNTGVMRILHTADWHLGDRLGRIDRTDDLRRAVERVAAHCRSRNASTCCSWPATCSANWPGPDALRDTIHHWQDVFAEFLDGGGTILTLTGNHDNENFCQTLRHAMTLAAPTVGKAGECVPPGRLYLAADPTFLRLQDRAGGFDVQFVLMPYPTPSRYLKGEAGQKYGSPDEKNRLLVAAFDATPARHPRAPEVRPDGAGGAGRPTSTSTGRRSGRRLFRLTEQEDVVVDGADLPRAVRLRRARAHPQAAVPRRHQHVRYCGSIERMDLGEQADQKGVVLVEVGPDGRTANRRCCRCRPRRSTRWWCATRRTTCRGCGRSSRTRRPTW